MLFFACPSSSCLTLHLIWQMVCSWRHMWGFNIAESPWQKKPLWKCAADTCTNRIMLQISVHIVLYTHHIVLHICVNSICAADISLHWRIDKIKDTRMQSAMLDQWSNMVLLCLPPPLTPDVPSLGPRASMSLSPAHTLGRNNVHNVQNSDLVTTTTTD